MPNLMTEKNRQSDACRLLEIVQEIKEEYYVGTLEAFEAVKARSRVYDNPRVLSGYINDRLSSRATYTATPERLAGIIDLLEEAQDLHGPWTDIGWSGFPAKITDFVGYANAPCELRYLVLGFRKDLGAAFPEKAERALVSLFVEANRRDIRDDDTFKSWLVADICDFLRLHGPIQSADDEEDICENFLPVNEIYPILDARPSFHPETLKDIEMVGLRHVNDKYLTLDKRIRRLQYDRLDHRFENRRNILATYLRQVCQGREGISYEKIVEEQDKKILTRRGHIALFEKECGRTSTITMRTKELLDEAIFVRHLLGSEKNFAIKFLRN